jgi:hypothetical protein
VSIGSERGFLRSYVFGQCGVLLQELDDAVCQLRVVHAEALHLVHGEEYPGQEELVFFLERQGETIDDRTQNLEQLGNSIVAFGLIHELEENVVNRSADI